MKKSSIKKIIGLLFVLTIILTFNQLAAAGESIKADYNPDESYICRVGESLILDLPEATAYQVDTADNQNWKLIKEMNYIWVIPNTPDNVLVLTVTNYNGDKLVVHITSKSKEELAENPIKRLVVKQFPHKEIPQYATEIKPTAAPAVDPQILAAEKLKQEEEIKKQLQAASEAKRLQEIEKLKQVENEQLIKEKEVRIKQEELARLQKEEEQKKQIEAAQLEKEAQDKKLAEQKILEQIQTEEVKEAEKKVIEEAKKGGEIYNVNTEIVNTDVKQPEIANPQFEENKPGKTEPDKNKKTAFLINISGGSYKINKESRSAWVGEIVAANKSKKGLFTQLALSANVNNFSKRYGQSIGFGIEKEKMGFGFFTFLDTLFIKIDQYKSTFHYQVRPAIRFKNNRFAITGFAAIALSKDQYTGKDDPLDPNNEIFNTALNHYGINIEGIIIPRKLFFQTEGAIAESKAYKLLLGIEYGISKNIGIYLEGSSTSYGDLPLLTNDQYGNDFTITAGLKFEINKANLDKQDQIIFPRDYPMVANVKKQKSEIPNNLTITLTASPKSGKAPLSVAFTAVLSGGKSPYTLKWVYGNQSQSGSSCAPLSAGGVNENSSYTYLKAGTYTTYVTVTDSLNQTAKSNTETIVVTDDGPTTHIIQATAGAGGSITPYGSVVVKHGSNQKFHVKAFTGYKIKSVKVDGVGQSAAVGKAEFDYEFKNVISAHTIEAAFELNGSTTHIIQATAGPGGSITPGGNVVVVNGANQKFQIRANTGYKITSVKVDGVGQSTAAGKTGFDYEFKNVISDHTIAAAFELNGSTTHIIQATAGPGGSITPGGNVVVVNGANQKFQIRANTGYKITSVKVDGVGQSGAAGKTEFDYEFVNVTIDHTIAAAFELNGSTTHIIQASAGSGGSITPSGAVVVNHGSDQEFHIKANTGYKITSVRVDGVGQSSAAGKTEFYYKFTNVILNHDITVDFAVISMTYTVTVTAGVNGSITPGTSTYNAGANASFSIQPNTGYKISQILLDGSPVSISNESGQSVDINNIQSNHTLEASFAVKTYTITVTSGANGSITPGTSTYNAGANASFSIQPNTGYKISQILLDGSPVSISNESGQSVDINNIQADHTLSATFTNKTYTVTVTAGANGNITPGTSTYNAGANASFSIQPNTGYKISQILLDGSPVSISNESGQSVDINNIQADHTLSATFTNKTYTVTVTAGANGSITPGTGSYNAGANASFSIQPNTGYKISQILLDGSPVSITNISGQTVDINNIQSNHILSATFSTKTVYVIHRRDIFMPGGACHSEYIVNTYINVYEGDNRSITIDDEQTAVLCGLSKAWPLDRAVIDGVNKGIILTWTFTNIQNNHSVDIYYQGW